MLCCLNLSYGVFHFLRIYLYNVDRFIAKCSVPENVLLCNFIYLEMHVLPLSTRRVDNHIELTSTLTEIFMAKARKKTHLTFAEYLHTSNRVAKKVIPCQRLQGRGTLC